MMTGMLDRHDADILVETAITKGVCSEYCWRVIDAAMQLMVGEGYVTENELDRIWRDNRIHRIVEGSNEVMQSFIFAYGGKQVAEQMISIQEGLLWDGAESASENLRRIAANATNPRVLARAIPLAAQLYDRFRPHAPDRAGGDARAEEYANRLSRLVIRHAHYFKLTSKWHREEIVAHQAAQARVADNAVILFALAASLSKMDEQLKIGRASCRERA